MGACLPAGAFAPQTYTWAPIRDRFQTNNPTLRAGRAHIGQSKTQEITAFLRPNPDLTVSTDGTQLTPRNGGYRPFVGTQYGPSVSYLHERENKRELRLDSAKHGTEIASSQQEDLIRTMLFTLRGA